jgi:hypothetical protein
VFSLWRFCENKEKLQVFGYSFSLSFRGTIADLVLEGDGVAWKTSGTTIF